jgi:hypothetical protein
MKAKKLNKTQKKALRKTDVSACFTPNFIKVAVDKLITYRTPKKIIDYIEYEKMKVVIGNPPYDMIRQILTSTKTKPEK